MYPDLKEWLITKGAILKKTHIMNKNGLRGIFAARNIPKKGVVLFVPEKLLITLETAKSNHLGPAMLEKDLMV